MTDDKNPDKKPSFFDNSSTSDEAQSWPPSHGYELEESDVIQMGGDSFFEVGDFGTMPEIISNKSNFDDLNDFDINELIDQPATEAVVEAIPEPIPEPTYIPEATLNPEPEPYLEPTLAPEEETLNSPQQKIIENLEIADDPSGYYVDENIDSIFETQSPSQTQETTNQSIEDDTLDQLLNEAEAQQQTRPFKAYSKVDFSQELLEEEQENEKKGFLANINRNVLIIIGVILISLGYFVYSTVFNRTYQTKSKRSKRPPKQKDSSVKIANKELIPIWEISTQKRDSATDEKKYIDSVYKISGRENPFAMPQSVIEDLRKAAEMAILKKQEPNTYRRKAYRATLLGVLTAKDNTIALINIQEADFDILEGTGKAKILKLATKEMDKAKKNTLEMGLNNFIGPWVISKIETPKGLASDAKVYLQYESKSITLYMGKAEELGIFDEAGKLDDLENFGEEANAEDDEDY